MTFFEIDLTLSPEFWQEHRKKLDASGSNTFESVHRCKDGTEIPVEITVNTFTFHDQRYSCSFAKDITERKRVERPCARPTWCWKTAPRSSFIGGPPMTGR